MKEEFFNKLHESIDSESISSSSESEECNI